VVPLDYVFLATCYFFKEKGRLTMRSVFYVCVHFQLLNLLTIFHKICCEHYTVGGHLSVILQFHMIDNNSMVDAQTYQMGALK
jgi:hypothetical protein